MVKVKIYYQNKKLVKARTKIGNALPWLRAKQAKKHQWLACGTAAFCTEAQERKENPLASVEAKAEFFAHVYSVVIN